MTRTERPRPSRVADAAALCALVAGALGLRLWNIGFGLPAVYRPDEDVVVGRAVGALHGLLDPRFADWPHLYFYVAAAWIWIMQRIGVVTAEMSTAYLAVRLLDAALGSLTVVVVYTLGRRAYGRAAGLAAAAALAAAFLNVRDSHFATIDVPLTAACSLALLAALEMAGTGSLRHRLLAGVWLGLASSVKYSGALVVASIAAALELRAAPLRPATLGRVLAGLVAVAGLGLLVFFATSPYLALEPGIFIGGLGHIFAHLGSPTTPDIGWIRFVRLALWYGMDPPLFLLSMAGIALAILRREPLDWILLAFLLAYYGLIGAGFSVFVRYADPMLPALCVLAGRALVVLAQAAASRLRAPVPLTLATGLLLALVPAVVHDVAYDRLIGQTDTRTLAADWLASRMGPTDRIATPYFAGPVHDQAQVDSERHSHIHGGPDPMVAVFLQNRLETGYSVHELTDSEVAMDSIAGLRRDGVTYVVFTTNTPDAGCLPVTPLERALQAIGPPLETFSPTGHGCPHSIFDDIDAYYVPLSGYQDWLRPGPLIRIYRLH